MRLSMAFSDCDIGSSIPVMEAGSAIHSFEYARPVFGSTVWDSR